MKPKKREIEARPVKEPTLSFRGPEEWSAWLGSHSGSASGVVLKIAKKGGPRPSLTYSEAVDVALAWGWIDGQKRAHDAGAWLQRFTPRRARSPWSKINRTRAEALMDGGKMEAPGLAEVKRAKEDGRWKRAYDSSRTSTVPDDLSAALTKNKRARAFFDAIDSANRYAILYRVQTAKKPQTRAKRVAEFVTMLAKHETIHPRHEAKARRSSARER